MSGRLRPICAAVKPRMRSRLLWLAVTLYGTASALAPPAGAQIRAPARAVPEICSFVAAAYNRGDQDKLWGYPDPVDIAGDGKLRHVYIVEQGTAHVHSIVASTTPLTPAEQDQAVNKDVDFYGSIGKDMSLETVPRILQYKGAYYVVYEGDGGPYDVVKPNVGELCVFDRHYAAVLGEDHAPALCAKARNGGKFARLPTQKLANEITVEDASTLGLPGPFSPTVGRYVRLRLDPAGTPVVVGYFKYESSAGAGCLARGVAFLQGQDIEKSPRNAALLAAESGMTDCRGSDAFVVRAGGQNLIEIDGGAAEQQTAPPRLLVRLDGDKIEKVCNVEQRATFTPQPATAR